MLSVVSYLWTIGDNGAIAAGVRSSTVVVNANNAGTFILSITDTNPDNCSSYYSKTITIRYIVNPMFNYPPNITVNCYSDAFLSYDEFVNTW